MTGSLTIIKVFSLLKYFHHHLLASLHSTVFKSDSALYERSMCMCYALAIDLEHQELQGSPPPPPSPPPSLTNNTSCSLNLGSQSSIHSEDCRKCCHQQTFIIQNQDFLGAVVGSFLLQGTNIFC